MNLNQLEGYFTKKVHDRAKVVVDNTLNLMVDELMYRSPVGQPDMWSFQPEDYTPGKYKSNWLHSIGSPVYVELEDTRDNSFQQKDCETGRRLKQQIASNKLLFTKHYFTNDVSYAKAIEYGSAIHNPQSQSKPHAVAGLVTQQTSSFLAKAKQVSK
jgi:hypothetical protein